MARKKNKQPPFVMIVKEMLRSDSWRAISNPARVAYVHLKAKCVSKHDDFITCSYHEMEPIMERRTYAKALRELETHGFIICTQRGGLFRKRNYFRFIEGWRSTNSSGNNATCSSGINATY